MRRDEMFITFLCQGGVSHKTRNTHIRKLRWTHLDGTNDRIFTSLCTPLHLARLLTHVVYSYRNPNI